MFWAIGNIWRPWQDTNTLPGHEPRIAWFGDRAGFMAEGDDKEKVNVLMSLQDLINVGKGIGYSGAKLQTLVRDQQDRQREEQQLEHETRREDAEREARKE